MFPTANSIGYCKEFQLTAVSFDLYSGCHCWKNPIVVIHWCLRDELSVCLTFRSSKILTSSSSFSDQHCGRQIIAMFKIARQTVLVSCWGKEKAPILYVKIILVKRRLSVFEEMYLQSNLIPESLIHFNRKVSYFRQWAVYAYPPLIRSQETLISSSVPANLPWDQSLALCG